MNKIIDFDCNFQFILIDNNIMQDYIYLNYHSIFLASISNKIIGKKEEIQKLIILICQIDNFLNDKKYYLNFFAINFSIISESKVLFEID